MSSNSTESQTNSKDIWATAIGMIKECSEQALLLHMERFKIKCKLMKHHTANALGQLSQNPSVSQASLKADCIRTEMRQRSFTETSAKHLAELKQMYEATERTNGQLTEAEVLINETMLSIKELRSYAINYPPTLPELKQEITYLQANEPEITAGPIAPDKSVGA